MRSADQIEDDICAPATGRRNLGRQVLHTDDQLLRDGMDRRVRVRRVPVGTDHAGAKASSNLGGGATDAAPGAEIGEEQLRPIKPRQQRSVMIVGERKRAFFR